MQSFDCYRCWREAVAASDDKLAFMTRQMQLCPSCGNKRCPKGSDHRLACTGSNEPGQPGSIYS